VQVDPIKLNLKPPGTERWKLKCDDPLSNFDFSFKLRRYTEAERRREARRRAAAWAQAQSKLAGSKAGAYTRSHFSSY